MIAGELVADEECWYRPITNTSYLSKGALTHQALKGQAFPLVPAKPYDRELSGRVLSLSGDLEFVIQDAKNRVNAARQRFIDAGKPVPSKIAFVGFMSAPVKEIKKQFPDGSSSGVVYTPLVSDNAHADVVGFDCKEDDQADVVRAHLQAKLRITFSASPSTLYVDCGAPNSPADAPATA